MWTARSDQGATAARPPCPERQPRAQDPRRSGGAVASHTPAAHRGTVTAIARKARINARDSLVGFVFFNGFNSPITISYPRLRYPRKHAAFFWAISTSRLCQSSSPMRRAYSSPAARCVSLAKKWAREMNPNWAAFLLSALGTAAGGVCSSLVARLRCRIRYCSLYYRLPNVCR